MHAYTGTPRQSGGLLYADKIFYVSPFFSSRWRLSLKIRINDQAISLVMRYLIDIAGIDRDTAWSAPGAIGRVHFSTVVAGEAITLQADCCDTF